MVIGCKDMAGAGLKADSAKEIKERREIYREIGKVPISRLVPLVFFKKVEGGFTTHDFARIVRCSIEQASVALQYYKDRKSWLNRVRIAARNGTYSRYFVTDAFPIDEAIDAIKVGQRVRDPSVLRCIERLIDFEGKKSGIEDG